MKTIGLIHTDGRIIEIIKTAGIDLIDNSYGKSQIVIWTDETERNKSLTNPRTLLGKEVYFVEISIPEVCGTTGNMKQCYSDTLYKELNKQTDYSNAYGWSEYQQ